MTLTSRHYALLSGVCVLLVGASTAPGNIADHVGDLWHYFTVSNLLMRGETPYRDFSLEYPPLALLPFAFPRLLLFLFPANYTAYVWAFLVQSTLLTSALTGAVLKVSSRCREDFSVKTAFLTLSIFLITCPNLIWRYDLFPAVLTILAFAALLDRKPLVAGVWLGLGTAAKLYPIVLLPVFLLYCIRASKKSAALKLSLGFFAAIGLCLLPFVALPPAALFSFVKYHQMRGLEIESIPAGLILLAHMCGLTSTSVIYNYGAVHLVSPVAPPIIRCLPVWFAFLYFCVLWKADRVFCSQAKRGKIETADLLVFTAASLLAFILANKVFSPQYLVWLLPFAPLLKPRPALAVLVVFVLTTVIFPYNFSQLSSMSPGAILLLNLRNSLLATIFVGIELRIPFFETDSLTTVFQRGKCHAPR